VELKLSEANKDGEKLLGDQLLLSKIKVELVFINQDRCEKWIAAVRCENWMPNQNTWMHFATGKKSNNLLAPNYVPSIFPYTESSIEKKLKGDVVRIEQQQAKEVTSY